MGNINTPENKEKIETCSIDQKTDALETRCDENLRIKEAEYEMLSSLTELWRHNLEVVKTGNSYFFKLENKGIILPIAFQINELPEKLNILNQILDLAQERKLKLTWDLHGRIIAEKKSLFEMFADLAEGESPHNLLLETNGEKYAKDEAEAIFKFAMNVFQIPKSNWNIEWEVCKTNNLQVCAENMWNEFIDNRWGEIIAGLEKWDENYIVLKNENIIEQAIATTD